jgi:CRP-like cAMP-binding protein
MLLRHFLHTLPGFEYMSAEDVNHLATAMRVESYPDGHVFVYQDKQSRELYLLLEGEVQVCHYGQSGRYHNLKTLRAGEFFGLLSLSDGAPAAASCAANGEVKVASLPYSAYRLLYQPSSDIGCRFQYVLAAQLARDLQNRHDGLRKLLVQLYSGQPPDNVACEFKP